MVRGGDQLSSKRGTQTIDGPESAGGRGENAALADLELRIAGQSVPERDPFLHHVFDLDPAASVGVDHSGVADHALGEAVQGEGGDGMDDRLGRVAGDALVGHARAELHLHLAHRALRALEAEGAPQLLGLPPGEARGGHGAAWAGGAPPAPWPAGGGAGAGATAMRSSWSWKSGTPRVRRRIGSR